MIMIVTVHTINYVDKDAIAPVRSVSTGVMSHCPDKVLNTIHNDSLKSSKDGNSYKEGFV